MSRRDREKNDDHNKRAILARRARFVAAAVATVGIACGKTTVLEESPKPCLSIYHPPPDAGPPPAPMVCLTVPVPQPMDGPPDASPSDASSAKTPKKSG